jgi:hypothetical protein
LAAVPSAGGTRYRMLETIRQYGAEQLSAAGEHTDVRTRHVRWCLATAAELARERPATGTWRAGFDAAADDIRAALGWASGLDGHHAGAHELALSLARLTFTRNLVGEAQQRYEQAASLATDPAAAASALRDAAAVAGCRMRGDDMYRLYRAAGSARDLAMAAATVYRFAGTFTEPPPQGAAAALLAGARELTGDDPAARAAVALAECGVSQDVPEAIARAERAVDLAQRTGDPVAQSAALDALTAAQWWAGDTFAIAATTRRRVDLLAAVPVTPASAHERANALSEAAETGLGVGDLAAARRWGEQLRDLPLLAERGDFATSRLLVADALAGNVDDVLAGSRRFRDAWERSGSRHAPNLAMAADAVAMVHGLRGDDRARAEWLAVADELAAAPDEKAGHRAVFEAIVLLHHGRVDEAMATLAASPGEINRQVIWVWLHWYAALRAEAAALAAHPDARRRIADARTITVGNPIAGAQLERAEALLDGDPDRMLAAAAAFDAADCRYQWARTLVLAGGEHAATGAAAVADIGLAAPRSHQAPAPREP